MWAIFNRSVCHSSDKIAFLYFILGLLITLQSSKKSPLPTRHLFKTLATGKLPVVPQGLASL